MTEFELSQTAQHWVNVVLIWVGFGALAGLAAKVLLPFREPSGPISTLLLGTVGSVLGLAVLSYFCRGGTLNPISPIGFFAATVGAFGLLIAYRLVWGLLRRDGGDAGG